jgi:hypothetical protein
LRLIEEGALDSVSVEHLAARLGLGERQLYFRTRRPQGPDAQYTKLDEQQRFHALT